ncbi:hypothetical protein LD001_27415, partial [Pseudomonas kurunegalensis]|nr:hypothetical protein [Pseudomonas kurunegalensis]
IAILADKLPPHQRDRARVIGLSLALIMRLGLLASISWMVPAQIAGQLNCSEKNVYSLLAEALGRQELSLDQALDLPEDLLMEVQDAFLDGEGELPAVSAIAPLFGARVPEGVLYCVRAALAAEFEL